MYKSNRKLSILHIVLSIAETNCTYNEHCLPWAEERDITICTYFKANLTPPKEISLFEGNNSLTGFIRVLKAALDEKDYDIIHAHTPHVGFLFLVYTMLINQRLMPATVCTVHNSYPNFKIRNKLLFIPIFAFFQRVVCCSQASFKSFPFLYKWLAGERLCFVQNGTDIDRIDRIIVKTQEYGRYNSFTIATVGRLIEIKNPLSVLMAFQKSVDPSSRLVFIGEGCMRDELLIELEASGNGNQVELTGLLPRDKVYEALTRADLFVSASFGEGLPVAVLEAMACRCPVILSDIPPHREIACDVNFIPMFQPDDIEGLSFEIKRFRQMSSSERLEIGEKCRNLVEKHFSLTTMHSEYEEVYASLLDDC